MAYINNSYKSILNNRDFCRQPLPDEQPEQEEGADEEDDMPSENYCDFTVVVSDASGNKGLVVEATSMDTEIALNNILVSDDI